MQNTQGVWNNQTGEEVRYLTLSDVGRRIREAINNEFGTGVHWITAEISDLSVRKGHCYLTLVEKMPDAAAPVSEFRGIIWQGRFAAINKLFQDVTGAQLTKGSVILFQATVKFDVKWGLSLVIENIEPAYTVGLIELERARTIAKLKQEGVFGNNKALQFPVVPQRIALISAKDSRGYEDFMKKLVHNPYKYRFIVDLFPSRLQGDTAAGEIVKQLINIFEEKEKYDLVVIVRGGGGSVDLNCFNDYRLSRAVARFPLPVITGIGHTANISVVDEVAYADRITPTDAADYIVEQTSEFESMLHELIENVHLLSESLTRTLTEELSDMASELKTVVRSQIMSGRLKLENFNKLINNSGKSLVKAHKMKFGHLISGLNISVKHSITREHTKINNLCLRYPATIMRNMDDSKHDLIQTSSKLVNRASLLLQAENTKLAVTIEKVNAGDPVKVLQKGYSITKHKNKSVKSARELKKGDVLTTILYEGTIESKIS